MRRVPFVVCFILCAFFLCSKNSLAGPIESMNTIFINSSLMGNVLAKSGIDPSSREAKFARKVAVHSLGVGDKSKLYDIINEEISRKSHKRSSSSSNSNNGNNYSRVDKNAIMNAVVSYQGKYNEWLKNKHHNAKGSECYYNIMKEVLKHNWGKADESIRLHSGLAYENIKSNFGCTYVKMDDLDSNGAVAFESFDKIVRTFLGVLIYVSGKNTVVVSVFDNNIFISASDYSNFPTKTVSDFLSSKDVFYFDLDKDDITYNSAKEHYEKMEYKQVEKINEYLDTILTLKREFDK